MGGNFFHALKKLNFGWFSDIFDNITTVFMDLEQTFSPEPNLRPIATKLQKKNPVCTSGAFMVCKQIWVVQFLLYVIIYKYYFIIYNYDNYFIKIIGTTRYGCVIITEWTSKLNIDIKDVISIQFILTNWHLLVRY